MGGYEADHVIRKKVQKNTVGGGNRRGGKLKREPMGGIKSDEFLKASLRG